MTAEQLSAAYFVAKAETERYAKARDGRARIRGNPDAHHHQEFCEFQRVKWLARTNKLGELLAKEIDAL